jgi:PPOX class probable F420-dependent enzyme
MEGADRLPPSLQSSVAAPRVALADDTASCQKITKHAAHANEEAVMVAIPAEHLDLLQQKITFAHLATIMKDGSPQVTPVWFDYTDGKIRINSAKGRVKTRNMQEGSPVALSILDPENAYRYIQIRGRVSRVTEVGASAHIDALAKKYLGKDKYPFSQPGEVRVTFEIEPASAQVMG